MLNVKRVLTNKFPSLNQHSPLFTKPLFYVLRHLFHEREVNQFLDKNQGIEGFEFVDKVLDYFNYSFAVSNRERTSIPAVGRVVIVANHPIGSLDGLVLLKLVSEVRRDVRIVVNDLLYHIKPLRSLLLPVDNMTKRVSRAGLRRIDEALQNEEAVIVFPAGEVSRSHPTGVKDGHWENGFLRYAQRANAPIVPIFVQGRNSSLFYGISLLYKPLSQLLLVNEMFNKTGKVLPIKIGEPIPISYINRLGLNKKETTRLVRRHLYLLARGKRRLFKTEIPIAHPESRQALKWELSQSEDLGHTGDGKRIYLFKYHPDSVVIKEIGRLRELSFRQVGEGTGTKRDLDQYDQYYDHIILWDEEDLEIVGAYRIGNAGVILQERGQAALYCNSLFQLHIRFTPYLEKAAELGRSFVQPKYWGRRSLDYLWYGIGAYLRQNPQIEYLYGPVSISNNYSDASKKMLIDFYRLHFTDQSGLATANVRYQPLPDLPNLVPFSGLDYHEDFVRLKEGLKHLGASVPTLYKQYTELCEQGGTRFLDFSVDPDFGDCIDGLVLVEVAKIRAKVKQRYIERRLRAA
jgi:putative hemolysin